MRTIIKPTTNKRGAFERQTDTAAARRRKEKTMNLYRITYGTPDSETETTNITERSETAARKAFKASCKAFCSIIPDIIGIELIREDVGATKQQERDTLAAIMQMVEELGPNSYLATAFAGCFEDAEENIENDFAFSMKEPLRIQQEGRPTTSTKPPTRSATTSTRPAMKSQPSRQSSRTRRTGASKPRPATTASLTEPPQRRLAQRPQRTKS